MKSIILAISCLLILVGMVSLATAQTGMPNLHVDVAFAPSISLKALSESVPFIVEAHVESVFPSSGGPGFLRTDAVLSVDRVIKGSIPESRFVLGQVGGIKDGREAIPIQYDLMQPGDHYILLLNSSTATGSQEIERPGLKRFVIAGVFAGLLKVNDQVNHGTMYASSGMPASFRASVDGKRLDDFLAELSSVAGK